MSGRVWVSSVESNFQLFDKPGLREKYYGENWTPARHERLVSSPLVRATTDRYFDGYALTRADFPEAVAVFDKNCFRRKGDLFAVGGGFYVVRGRLAEVLANVDLGEGSLISFPIYQEDLKTTVDDNFYYLNFGSRKNSFLPKLSKNVRLLNPNNRDLHLWIINLGVEDNDIALSSVALAGPDLWVEETVHSKIFMSEALVTKLLDTNIAVDFRLKECRIVEAM
jgi:hypothetical protein